MTKNNSREHHCPLEPTLVLILNLPDYTGEYLHYKQNMIMGHMPRIIYPIQRSCFSINYPKISGSDTAL